MDVPALCLPVVRARSRLGQRMVVGMTLLGSHGENFTTNFPANFIATGAERAPSGVHTPAMCLKTRAACKTERLLTRGSLGFRVPGTCSIQREMHGASNVIVVAHRPFIRSRSRLSSSTLTRGSPSVPSCRGSTWACTNNLTCSSLR